MALPSNMDPPSEPARPADDDLIGGASTMVGAEKRRAGFGMTLFIATTSFLAGALAIGLTGAFKEKPAKAGLESAKWLMHRMDKNRQRRVSKDQFLGFMAEEFERLDQKKDGLLDVRELSQLVVGSEKMLKQRPEGKSQNSPDNETRPAGDTHGSATGVKNRLAHD
jgi:hypothetical protein